MGRTWFSIISIFIAARSASASSRPVLHYLSGGESPIISDAQRAADAGFGFEGGRVLRINGTTWLFTAEFQGWPVNANMRLGIWRSRENVFAGQWERVSTIVASHGDGTSIASWNRTCSKKNLDASPWAPFPVYDEGEERWHVHWVSYACDLSWVVRVGIGNLMGAASTVRGLGGIAGPYEPYGVVIGPNATSTTATRWGDLSSCSACHDNTIQPPPVYCGVPPCQFDNGITGGAICAGPFGPLPLRAGQSKPLYAAFVGLNHDLAWAESMRGPWTIGTPATTGQLFSAKITTPSSMYTENPVVSRITMPGGGLGFIAVFDTVSPSGGWCEEENVGWTPCSRGESYGFGVAFSADGQFWSSGVDVYLPGGCRTPLGLLEEDDGTMILVFTRRFPDCRQQAGGLRPGSRGDSANDRTMCANLYAARFNITWGEWSSSNRGSIRRGAHGPLDENIQDVLI